MHPPGRPLWLCPPRMAVFRSAQARSLRGRQQRSDVHSRGRAAAAASTGHFGRGPKTAMEPAAEAEAEAGQERPGKAPAAAARKDKGAGAGRETKAGGASRAGAAQAAAAEKGGGDGECAGAR